MSWGFLFVYLILGAFSAKGCLRQARAWGLVLTPFQQAKIVIAAMITWPAFVLAGAILALWQILQHLGGKP